MTAFAASEREAAGWVLAWEARSVNHRYLDLALRLPEAFRFLETETRSRVGQQIKRGRLDLGLTLKKTDLAENGLQLEPGKVKAILAAASAVEALSEKPLASFSALDILRWPGLLHELELDRDTIAPLVLELLEETLNKMVAARQVEGLHLAELIESRSRQIREIVASVRLRMPEVLTAVRQRLKNRLAELEAKPDADRLEQEMVYLAQKLDVDEELDRLESHLNEVTRALGQEDPAGRRLDFLLQEMNREANTLGSKSADAETTRASVAMKVLIEQMREQVQNIE